MRRILIGSVLALLISPALGGTSSIRLFTKGYPKNLQGIIQSISNLPSGAVPPCGVTLYIPWGQVDSGTGSYNWAFIDNEIAQVKAARNWPLGHEIGLVGVPADETCDEAFSPSKNCGKVPPVDASGLDTPAYVIAAEGGVGNLISCGPEVSNKNKVRPATPVWWHSAVMTNWEKFAAALLKHYSGDPEISYVRFAFGAGSENSPMIQSDDKVCKPKWQAAGMSYQQWVGASSAFINYVQNANAGLSNQLGFGMSDLHSWESKSGNTAMALAQVAAPYHWMMGQAGWTQSDPHYAAIWNPIFSYAFTHGGHTYMQPANDHLSGTPTIDAYLKAMMQQGNIQLTEEYHDLWDAAYRAGTVSASEQTAIKDALNNIGQPTACDVDPNWTGP
jgi:hypothetical protein